jgi:hypothetical protein
VKEYEYQSLYMGDPFRAKHATIKNSMTFLNQLGRQGWELAASLGGYVILKRELEDVDDAEDL